MIARPALRISQLGVVVAMFVLGACGGPTVDGDRLADMLRTDLGATSLRPERVECPRDVVARSGETFTCTATLPGGAQLIYDVTLTSDQGDYRYALAAGQSVDSAELAAQLQVQVRGTGPDANAAVVTCPPVIAAPAGAVDVRCAARDGDIELPIHVIGAPGQLLTWSFAIG